MNISFDALINNPIIDPIYHLSIATGIGALLGLERQLSNREQQHTMGGIRTFAIVSSSGLISGVLGKTISPWLPVVTLLALAILLSVTHLSLSRDGRKGITSEVSLIGAFLLGLLVNEDQLIFAIVAALVFSFLMSIKVQIESMIKKTTEEELFAIFKFILVSVLILPLLPNTYIDPWGVINPQQVWTVVVLVLSLSFLGYMLMKFWGAAKGIMFMGLLGGLVSSTAVTWVFSRKSSMDHGNSRTYGLSNLMAVVIMLARVVVLAEVVNASLTMKLFMPFSLLFFTGAFVIWILKKRHGNGSSSGSATVILGNPFNLKEAISFAVMYLAITVLVTLANKHFGVAGVYIVSALSGLASTDAIVISMAKLGGDKVPLDVAMYAILIAAMSNNLVKLGIATGLGTREYRNTMATGIFAILAVALIWTGLNVL